MSRADGGVPLALYLIEVQGQDHSGQQAKYTLCDNAHALAEVLQPDRTFNSIQSASFNPIGRSR